MNKMFVIASALVVFSNANAEDSVNVDRNAPGASQFETLKCSTTVPSVGAEFSLRLERKYSVAPQFNLIGAQFITQVVYPGASASVQQLNLDYQTSFIGILSSSFFEVDFSKVENMALVRDARSGKVIYRCAN